jgi:hypothetical protein
MVLLFIGNKAIVAGKREEGAIGKKAKSVAGTFTDRFCRPGDHSDDLAVSKREPAT